MDFNPNKQTDLLPSAGKLLIAAPVLTDPNFARSVIFLCEYNDEGAVGFVLNKPTPHMLGDLLPELVSSVLAIFQGGPVQLDTLHMLHRSPEVFGGNEIVPGVFWGGSYEALQEAILENHYQSPDLRLFVGYSGWSAGQLEEEIAEGSWIVADVNEKLLFDTDTDNLWESAIRSLGKEFEFLVNVPLDPQLN